MAAYRTEGTIEKHGRLRLEKLPFQAGEEVEVIVLSRELSVGERARYSLRGESIQYEEPTEPVAQSDWEAPR